jgi:HD superfamily phosphodiesterase
MSNTQKLNKLNILLKELYLKNSKKLLFHGWHHISFVSKKGAKFAKPIGADVFLVESAGLVHDLNYIVLANSEIEAGQSLREKYHWLSKGLKKTCSSWRKIVCASCRRRFNEPSEYQRKEY